MIWIRFILLIYITTSVSSAFGQSNKQDNPYLKKENYIPYPHTPNDYIKTIHIAIHIWQRADGTGNLQDTPETKVRLDKVVEWMNNLYEKNYEAAIPALSYPTDTIYDSRIRFKLEGIYFYKDASKDSSYCHSTRYLHNKKLNDYLAKHFPERVKTLNLHLFRGSFAKASGYSEAGSVGTFYRTNPEMDTDPVHDWWLSKHWAHEVAHGLDLWHTYDINNSYQQNCNHNHTDFLWDIYDTTVVNNSGMCTTPLIPNSSGNNLMGGGEGNFISNLQMGIMHRSMVLENVYNKGYNVRDFVTGFTYWAKEITQDEIWDISMKMYQSIIVKKGATLTIKAEIQMPPKGKITVEKGAKLIVDGGVITNEKYYDKKWKGIKVHQSKKLPSDSGVLHLLNGGKVLHGKIK